MNKVILSGRLTGDPEVRATQQTTVARYRLAVDKPRSQEADFISCVCFGKSAEFVEKYLSKGMKIIVTGRITTGSYKNKNGENGYTTDVVVEDHEFAESKKSSAAAPSPEDEFISIPDNASDEGIPFV